MDKYRLQELKLLIFSFGTVAQCVEHWFLHNYILLKKLHVYIF